MEPEEVMKSCSKCGHEKPLSMFYSDKRASDGCKSECKTCGGGRWYRHLQEKYGVSKEQYLAMEKGQNGVCAICSRECETGNRLSVDHCHRTGKVRGLLCHRCNRGIGHFKDSPALIERALAYLE